MIELDNDLCAMLDLGAEYVREHEVPCFLPRLAFI